MPDALPDFHPLHDVTFRIVMNGRPVAGVSKVSRLGRSTQVIVHRAGDDTNSYRKSPGPTRFDPVTLERGVSYDYEFERWANKIFDIEAGFGAEVSLADFRRDLIIEIINADQQKVAAFQLYRCWPSLFVQLPAVDGSGGALFERLQLEIESFERDYSVTPPPPLAHVHIPPAILPAPADKTAKK